MFIFLGAFFIVSNNNLHLSDRQQLSQFGNLYSSWLGDIFDNVKSVTGYVAKFEWLPEERADNITQSVK
jgi:hypothetical protein